MLQIVMTSDRPDRKSFAPGVAGDWDYKAAVELWDKNPLYGWCRKNTKANGAQYDLYRDGLKIYTTINATMQKYAEEAVWAQMGGNVQPMMDRVLKGRQVFSRTSARKRNRRLSTAQCVIPTAIGC